MKDLLIALLIIEIIPLMFGIVWNWIFLPKNSTIKDIIGDLHKWEVDEYPIVPLFVFIIPIINFIFVGLGIVTMIFVIFNKLLDKTNLVKWFKPIKTKILNAKIK